jgi:hypothetical protein
MRCAHPDEVKWLAMIEEFVPQWPSNSSSVNHGRRKAQCGTNAQPLEGGLDVSGRSQKEAGQRVPPR